METMKAADASGGNNNIRIIDIPKPSPGAGEIIVKVECSAVEDGEEQVLKGSMVGKFLHWKSRPLVFGWNIAGVVDSVGSGVDLTVGDAVWGHLDFSPFQKQGSYCEYVVMRANAVAKRPEGLDAAQGASFATTGLTALQSIRNYGGLESGKTLLVIGAGGSIGGVAVGIGKKLDAKVMAVCSTRDVEKVTARGADRIFDRKQEDFLKSGVQVDVILDVPSKYSFGQCSTLLEKGGAYVDLHPWTLMTGFIPALLSGKKCKFVQVQSKKEDLELLGKWLTEGMEIPIAVESRFPVKDLGQALQKRRDPARNGAIIVDVEDGWG